MIFLTITLAKVPEQSRIWLGMGHETDAAEQGGMELGGFWLERRCGFVCAPGWFLFIPLWVGQACRGGQR